MKISTLHLRKFKRFEDLTITELPESARLIVVTGPNGTGKSGILEALNTYRRSQKWGLGGDAEYFFKKSDGAEQVQNLAGQVQVQLYGGGYSADQLVKGIWVRPAYRHQAEFNMQGVQQQQSPIDDPGQDRLITPDSLVGANYSRLLTNSIASLYDAANRGTTAGELVDQVVGLLQESLAYVFDDLQLDNLTDPLREGTFYFTKGTSKHFSFKNLSAGERAAFDILLDVVVRRTVFDDTIYAIDEPELHLGSRVQARLLDRILHLLPNENCQLWIATHSPGMMKRALELYQTNSSSVAFLDTFDQDFDQPTTMKPIVPTRDFWRRSMEVALDDIAALVAPAHVVLCEGQEIAAGFDADCYRAIFGSAEPGVEFISVGNSFEVKDDKRGVAAAIQVLAPGTKITKLVDRDDLSTNEIAQLASDGTKVLSKRNIEGYLLDDEILTKLYRQHGKTHDEIGAMITEKERLRREAEDRGKAADDLKPIGPNMKTLLCRELSLTGRGSTFAEFARNELVPLITSDTAVFTSLHEDIFGGVRG